MADQKTIEAYDKAAQQYGDTRTLNFWEPQLLKFKEYVHSGKILDVGCGTGRDTSYLTTDGFEYIGIDASESMLKYARSKNPSVIYIQMDFNDLAFEAQSFEGFWAAAVLLHAPKNEIRDVLKKLYDLLKDKGVGFISIRPKDKLEEGYVRQEKWGGIERYFAFYTIDEFTQLLVNAGLLVMEQGEVLEKEGTRWLTFFVQKHEI